MSEVLRARLVAVASELYSLSERVNEEASQETTAPGASYRQGMAFGVQMAISEVLAMLEDLSKSREGKARLVDDVSAWSIDAAARLYRLAEEARRRGEGYPPPAHDYWLGVSVGLEMAVAEAVELSQGLDRTSPDFDHERMAKS